jgi:hypothetical protein
MTLNAPTGVVSGTPTNVAGGTPNATMTATIDGVQTTASVAYSYVVSAAP